MQGPGTLLIVGAYCLEAFVLSVKLPDSFALGGKVMKYCRGEEFRHIHHGIPAEI
jgi:hypothetical protein